MLSVRLFHDAWIAARLLVNLLIFGNSVHGYSQLDFQRIQYADQDMPVDLNVGLWAWPLPMDFDNDGDMDLVVSCPDKPSNGTYFFENVSGKGVKMPVFEVGRRIADGYKNMQVSFVNNQPRVLGPGVEYKDFETKVFNNPQTILEKNTVERLQQKMRFSQWKYVDFDDDGDLDMLVGLDDWKEYGWDNAYNEQGNWTNGGLHGYIYYLENTSEGYLNRGRLQAVESDIDVYGAVSPNMYDFDNDGDLDLICGEFLDGMSWYENVGSRSVPAFAAGRKLVNSSGPIQMDLQMIIPVGIDWDQDGDIDLVVGDEDGRVALIENMGKIVDRMPEFLNPQYFQQRGGYVKFGALVTPFAVDWDQDGDQDLICGNSAGYIGFMENMGDPRTARWNKPVLLEAGGSPIRYMAGKNGSIQGPAEAKWGYTTLSVADWDSDGLNDIIVNSIWGKLEWYKNIGSKGNPALEGPKKILVRWPDSSVPPKPAWNWWNPQPGELVSQWRTTPNAIDWNKDGIMDLVTLDHQGYLAYFEGFMSEGTVLLKAPQRIFYGVSGSEFTSKNEVVNQISGPLRLNNGIGGSSGRRKWCFVDWDSDGDLDILANGINVVFFENTGTLDGKVQFVYRGNISEQVLAGHTTSPTVMTLDNGNLQLLVGAEDGYLYQYRR